MYDPVRKYLQLTDAETAFLQTIEQQMGIMADLSRADILLYSRMSEQEAVVLTHAEPHSIARVYNRNRLGRVINMDEKPGIKQALVHGRSQKNKRGYITEGAPAVKQVLPIYFPPPVCPPSETGQTTEKPRVIAALLLVTNLLEYERLRLRNRVFRQALKKLQTMVRYGQLSGTQNLTPFGEQDGIIFVDTEGIIRYVSGVANNLYRRLGYKDALIGRHLSHLETDDERLLKLALAENQCVEQSAEEAGRFCIRKVVPLVSYPSPLWCWPFIKPLREKRYGALITLHDDTEQRTQERELQIKNALIQEVHHRVKNNLQTIAGLVRMQTRRTQSDEARTVLNETLHRILSVAVIHEFLSSESSNIINIKEVGHKIIGQLQQGVLDPDLHIQFKITGDSISLPPRQATACSLILNELLQNAIEHGFADRNAGVICINLEDKGDEAMISVIDNGHGLPADFQLEQSPTLGLQIVRTLVESDLKGRLQFGNSVEGDEGLSVSITFPKTTGG